MSTAPEESGPSEHQQQERPYQSLFDAVGVGLIHHAADGKIISANATAAEMLGLTGEQLQGLTPMDPRWRAVHEDGSPFPGEEHPATFTVRTGIEQTAVVVGVRKPDGTLTWLSVTSRLLPPEAAGAHGGVVVSFTDITPIIETSSQTQQELESELLHDSLTGLPNRALLMNRLEQALGNARRHGTTLAVLFLDLDHFKDLNDTHGHEAGDRALIAVGGRIADALRPGDTVARLAGDEFIALCIDCTVAEAEAVAQRICEAIAQAPTATSDVPLSASIGIAVSGDPALSPTDLIVRADTAMYMAKQAGRAGHAVFTAS